MVSVIIVAAGSSRRMGGPKNKVFMDLNGQPVLFYSIQAFSEIKEIEEIILVLREDEIEEFKDLFKNYNFNKIIKLVAGGKDRSHSVYNGLKVLSENSEKVLIHDGARPLISKEIIKEVINKVKPGCGVAPAIEIKDTIKEIDDNSFIKVSLNRDKLRAIQTPQGFVKSEIIKSYENHLENERVTDDTSLYLMDGHDLLLIKGDSKNLKLTEEIDFIMSEILIKIDKNNN